MPNLQLGQMYVSFGPIIAIVGCPGIIIKSVPFTLKIVTIWITHCEFRR